MKDALQDRCNCNIRFLEGRKIAQKKPLGFIQSGWSNIIVLGNED